MFATVLEDLATAISAVADLDLDTLDDGSLDELVVTLGRLRHRFDAAGARPLARWHDRAVWAGDGSLTAAGRLARDTHTSTASARRHLRHAGRLAAMPATAAAVAAGDLSVDHVDLLAQADRPHRRHLFERDERLLVDQLVGLRWKQACRVVAYWAQRADAESPDPDPPAEPPEHLHASDVGGVVRLDGRLGPLGGHIVLAELERLEHQLYLADQTAGIVRTRSERMAAAMIEMATRSAATPAGGQRPRPLLTILAGDATLAHICELAAGTVIAPDLVVPLLADCDLETILFADPDTVVATTPRRTFTGKLRRAIAARDRHCQHPSGCDIPATRCDIDHVVPVADGGETSQWNGRLECTTHNRNHTKHDGHATPRPARAYGYLDVVDIVLRWRTTRRHRQHPPDHPDIDGRPAA